MRDAVKILFWLWLAPYVIAYAAGFATAMLIGPIRRRWLDTYDEKIDIPNVEIPIVKEFYRPVRKKP